jgi:hypothetical protein
MQLSIDVHSDPITGSVSNGSQVARPFTGWIELTAAIEAARTANHAGEASTPEGGGGGKH